MYTNRENTESIAINFAELRLICATANDKVSKDIKCRMDTVPYKIVIESEQTLFFRWHWHIGYPALPSPHDAVEIATIRRRRSTKIQKEQSNEQVISHDQHNFNKLSLRSNNLFCPHTKKTWKKMKTC